MNARQESHNLDLLRSCAVLFVFVAHLMEAFPDFHIGSHQFGYLGLWGVLLFFVHTSLVLMFSLERQQQRWANQPIYWSFLIRRCFRIYPLSILMVLFVVAFALPVGTMRGGQFLAIHPGWSGLFANLLLIQNIVFGWSVLAPLWSLPYEMQMYLLLPALYLLARFTKTLFPLLAVWIVSLLLALVTPFLQTRGLPDVLLYLPCFIPGIIAYKLSKLSNPRLPAFLWPVCIFVISAAYLPHPSSWRGPVCCLLVGLLAPQFQELSNVLLQRIFHSIARYSYGIYLTHWICIWFAFRKLGGLPLWEQWAVLAITATLSPVILYHAVEAPMIRLGNSLMEGKYRKTQEAAPAS